MWANLSTATHPMGWLARTLGQVLARFARPAPGQIGPAVRHWITRPDSAQDIHAAAALLRHLPVSTGTWD
jgi:hypothetical protein